MRCNPIANRGQLWKTAGCRKGDKIKNINVTIEKVIDKFEIHTTNMHEDIGKVKEMVAEALPGAVNDVNYAM